MIVFAPGVTFDKEAHEYYYRGVQLSGVTCKIGPVSGYGHMREGFKNVLGEMAAEGNHVHDTVEEWIKSGLKTWNTIHPAAIFVRDTILGRGNLNLQAETLVSDFKRYASAVDVLSFKGKNKVEIFDIKRSFNREYVTWQLSIYKYLIEMYSDYKVVLMGAFASKDRRFFDDIKYKGKKEVERLLYD